MVEDEPLFRVDCDWCGECVLLPSRWKHVLDHHPEVAPYVKEVEQTLRSPNLVYESRHRKATRVFYARGLVTDHPFRDCYVAVCVRYKMEPSQVWTAYLPINLSSNPGRLLYAAK